MPNLHKAAEISVILIIAFASITELIEIKGTHFIQPSELVFLICSPIYFLLLRKERTFTKMDGLFLFYVLIFVVNLMLNPSAVTLFELLGVGYFYTLFLLISRVLAYSAEPDIFLTKAIVGLLGVSIFSGLLAYFLHILGLSDSFVYFYEGYPYFGDVWRVSGFSWSPILLSNICFCLFLLPQLGISGKWKVMLFILGFIVGCLTLAKEIVIFIALFAFLWYFRNAKGDRTKFLPLYSVPIAIAMVGLTFFVVKPAGLSKKEANLMNRGQIVQEPVFTTEKFELYPTTYYYLFQAAIALTRAEPITGVGSGRFKMELRELRKEGKYPGYFRVYDTHDFYWGQTAELGVIYLIFLVFFLKMAWEVIRNKDQFIPTQYHLSLSVIFIFFIITMMVGGTKHYRQFWIFLAIVNGFMLRNTLKNKTAPVEDTGVI